ncbi:MAG TPA: gliding motility lipoprotein GldD [Prolixibacteraceae bacterium]|nr:gliding motility lipoprotein GldD [Prolixibacteraceae bacterium]
MKIKLLAVLVLIPFLGCKQNYTPKPQGYYRINFPEKRYQTISNGFPYQFDIPVYSEIQKDTRNPDKPYWINIVVPENKAELHLSYYKLDNSNKIDRFLLAEFMEESRRLAYKHSLKASSIDERIFINPEQEVYGTIYDIAGNAASPMQFFITDSTTHFLRGALYIRSTPNIDSLKPVIEFLETDIVRLIETAKWN